MLESDHTGIVQFAVFGYSIYKPTATDFFVAEYMNEDTILFDDDLLVACGIFFIYTPCALIVHFLISFDRLSFFSGSLDG